MERIKNWFRSLGSKIERWSYGRYGFDELSQFLNITALVLLLGGIFINPALFAGLSLAIYIFALYRTCSKNHIRRREELNAYLKLANPVKDWFRLQKRRRSDRKTHRYFKCSQCKKVLRVPKGKGKIKIRCPQCGTECIKKT